MNLFVGNLSAETTDADLRNIFSEFGDIVSVRVLKDMETGMSRGFGFVEMAEKFTAYDAIDNIDCTFLKGNIISVKEAKPKTTDRNKPTPFGAKKPYSKPSAYPLPPRRDPNRL
jgi:RNA recognition motif-containing protein